MSAPLSLEALLPQPRIDLSSRSLVDSDLAVLAQLLEQSAVLKELNLHDNRLAFAATDDAWEAGGRFVEALGRNGTIEVLGLGSNRIGAAGCERLAKAVGGHKSLRELHLGDNQIGDAGTQTLASALSSNTTLRTLSLYSNAVKDEGTAFLATALASSPSLKTVWLHENRIGDVGGRALAAAVRANAGLEKVFVVGNAMGAEAMEEIERMTTKNGAAKKGVKETEEKKEEEEPAAEETSEESKTEAKAETDKPSPPKEMVCGTHLASCKTDFTALVGDAFKAVSPRNEAVNDAKEEEKKGEPAEETSEKSKTETCGTNIAGLVEDALFPASGKKDATEEADEEKKEEPADSTAATKEPQTEADKPSPSKGSVCGTDLAGLVEDTLMILSPRNAAAGKEAGAAEKGEEKEGPVTEQAEKKEEPATETDEKKDEPAADTAAEATAATETSPTEASTSNGMVHNLASCGTGLGSLVEDALKAMFRSSADTQDVAPTDEASSPLQCEAVPAVPQQVEEVTKQMASCTNGLGGLVERAFDASPLRFRAAGGAIDGEEGVAATSAPIEDVPTLQSALAAGRAELDALRSLLASKEAEVASLHESIENSARLLIPTAMTVKNNKIDELAQKLEEDTARFEATIAERDASLKGARKLKDDALEEAARLTEENEKHAEEMKRVTEELDAKFAAAIEEMDKAAAKERTAKDEALAEVESLKAKMADEAKAAHAALQAGCDEVAATHGELDAARGRIAELEGQLAQANERIDAFGDPLKLLTMHFEEREGRVAELEAALAAKEAEAAAIAAEHVEGAVERDAAVEAEDAKVERAESPTVEGPAVASAKDQAPAPAEPTATAAIEARDDAEAVVVCAE